MDILNIVEQPMFDDRIVKHEAHTYNPYANSTFGYNDEIRIPIQQQDLYTLPCESFLYVEGKVVIRKPNDASIIKLGNNCIAFMFEEIQYELNGAEIDCNRNVGITSTLKNYISFTCDEDKIMKNAGWNIRWNDEKNVNYHFNFCVLLKILLGFCENYKHIVINARHELILIRSRNDNNCLVGSSMLEPEIELFKVQWRIPHVILNDITKLSLVRVLESGRNLSMYFGSWDLYEYPMLQNTTKHSWSVKTATQLEKPRHVIFALQTEFYPYDDLNTDFNRNKYALLYNMYIHFSKAYYTYSNRQASHQNDSINNSTVDVRIEFDCGENIPANTTIMVRYGMIMVQCGSIATNNDAIT
ncbi:uncharacterized protein LOC143186453 [Calliopsis andreniformis]|uniref:uncharacterized protein LOC143186453 n=1 Tax=Calliopsis andreniformis TaxID=337506 RepID=UPI003FCE7715